MYVRIWFCRERADAPKRLWATARLQDGPGDLYLIWMFP